MSNIEEQRRLLLQQRAIAELKERIAREAYLSVREVAERLNLSREKVDVIPVEILPYADHGANGRAYKRYHPADVLALDARLRAWGAARSRNEGEAYLRGLREELEARDAAALELAREAHEAVAHLIALLRNTAPELLALVDAQRVELERLRSAVAVLAAESSHAT